MSTFVGMTNVNICHKKIRPTKPTSDNNINLKAKLGIHSNRGWMDAVDINKINKVFNLGGGSEIANFY